MYRRLVPMMIVAAALAGSRVALADSNAQNHGNGHDELSSQEQQASASATRGAGKKPGRPATCSSPTSPENMAFESEGLDLDAGAVVAAESPIDMDPDVDVIFAYNSDTSTHLRVMVQYPAMMAILSTPFEDVSCDDVSAAEFSEVSEDVPVNGDVTVLVTTAEGRTYKLGNAVEYEDMTVDFEFAELCVACTK
jgi:hypothetical protein